MKVLVTGASGLIGTALSTRLEQRGDMVVRLVRRSVRNRNSEVLWRPDRGEIDAESLADLDGVVHLAGENIASGRWTSQRKRRILDSRVDGTRLLCRTLAGLKKPPKVVVSASAVGYYGDCGERAVDETAPNGRGFLAEVCREWERATLPCEKAGIRTVTVRLGVVLTTKGGALTRMLTAFRIGMGGRIGNGRQYLSWISLDDCVDGILYCLDNSTLSGPVNLVSPEPVTNSEFTKILADTVNRWAILPVPESVVRILFGEMGVETVLSSCKVRPKCLVDDGFLFRHSDLLSALRETVL